MGLFKILRDRKNNKGLTESRLMKTSYVINKDGEKIVFVMALMMHLEGHIEEIIEKYEATDVKEIRAWNGLISLQGLDYSKLIMIECGEWMNCIEADLLDWRKAKEDVKNLTMSLDNLSEEGYEQKYYGAYERL